MSDDRLIHIGSRAMFPPQGKWAGVQCGETGKDAMYVRQSSNVRTLALALPEDLLCWWHRPPVCASPLESTWYMMQSPVRQGRHT